jgi:hypothetical protein
MNRLEAARAEKLVYVLKQFALLKACTADRLRAVLELGGGGPVGLDKSKYV